jgi:glycosyltransferase, family 2
MEKLLFSICIPSYNRPQELKNLLQSIDFSEPEIMEIVICEDKSPRREEIRKIVEEFKTTTRYKIIYVENKENLGYDGNLRALINNAQGNFIIFMGDDDTFIPNVLDNYALFLKERLEYGYILRSYRNVYKNGQIEYFQYFSENKDFTPSADTYITLFDKSVFISGFTINRKFAKEFETTIFDGSLLYQLYLLAEVTQKYPSAYFHQPLTQATEGGTPFFGSSEAEKKLYTPGTITTQNSLNFMNWYLKIINYISDKHKNDTADRILLNMSKYSYPVLAIQRNKGRKQFNEYARELAKLGFNKSIYFYIYYWSLFLFGTRFNDTMIRTLKKIIGRRPKL